jgi:hypothetical protein
MKEERVCLLSGRISLLTLTGFPWRFMGKGAEMQLMGGDRQGPETLMGWIKPIVDAYSNLTR